jgi:hypothetical protein
MFKGMCIKSASLIVGVILLLVPELWAKSVIPNPATTDWRSGYFYEGQEVIEQYARLMKLSPDEAQKVIDDAREARISGMSAGGESHFAPFIPECSNPPYDRAYALFNTGYGPFNVQFHGSTVWRADGFCGQSTCTYLAWADPLPGQSIWVYSVTAGWSAHISNWCSDLTPTLPSIDQNGRNN